MKKILGAVLLAAALSGCAPQGQGPKLLDPSQRPAAPEVSGYFLNAPGVPSLEKLRGKVVLLDFWATWCGPCRAEIPSLVHLYQVYHPKGVEFLALSVEINSNVPRTSFEQFLDTNGIHYPTGLASEKTSSDYGVDGIPASFFIDRGGKVALSFVGLHEEDDFSSVFDRLLAEPAPVN